MQERFKQQSFKTPNLTQLPTFNCAVCQSQCYELLGLICGHDVCLECASKSYFADNFLNKKQYSEGVLEINSSIFWCQVCYQQTIIERSSIEMMANFIKKKNRQHKTPEKELKKLAVSQQVKKHSSNRKKQRRSDRYREEDEQQNSRSRSSSRFSIDKMGLVKSNYVRKQETRPENHYASSKQREYFDDYLQLVKSHKILSSHTLADSERTKQLEYNKRKSSQKMASSSNKSPLKSPYFYTHNERSRKFQNRFPCSVHEDEELGYFCYHCKKSLCPECAINGPHKSHEVLSLKRYPTKLQQFFEQMISETNRHRHKLQRYLKQIQQWVDNSMGLLCQNEQIIKKKFESLHNILVQKQEQLLSDLKNKCEEDIKKVKKESRFLTDLAKQAKKSERVISQIFRQQPKNWDIFELQRQKQMLVALNKDRLKDILGDTKVPQTKTVRIGLITQALQLIQELVIKFKLEFENSSKPTY